MVRYIRKGGRPPEEGSSSFGPLPVNPVTRVRMAQAFSRIRGVFRNGVDIAGAINEMGATPRLRNYAAVAIVAASKIVNGTEFHPGRDKGFRVPAISWTLNKALSTIFAGLPQTKMLASGDISYQVTELDNITVLFGMASGSVGDVSDVYVAAPDEMTDADIVARMGREAWKSFGSRIEVALPSNFGPESTGTTLSTWMDGEQFTSEATENLLVKIRKYMKAGHRRSYLVHGPPGSGKSCMIQAVARSMDIPTMIVDQSQVTEESLSSLMFCVKLLQPEALIIDDFDRVPDSERMTGIIDGIRKMTKLFFVTMNHKDEVDPAVIRAGRFDEFVAVERVRNAVDIVPEVSAEILAEIDAWPIAFIEELRIRIDVLGPECAENEVAELRPRVALNTNKKKRKEITSKSPSPPTSLNR